MHQRFVSSSSTTATCTFFFAIEHWLYCDIDICAAINARIIFMGISFELEKKKKIKIAHEMPICLLT